jgi:hypothetical protein
MMGSPVNVLPPLTMLYSVQGGRKATEEFWTIRPSVECKRKSFEMYTKAELREAVDEVVIGLLMQVRTWLGSIPCTQASAREKGAKTPWISSRESWLNIVERCEAVGGAQR